RSDRDWSSDVCSSDLQVVQEACERVGAELLVDAYHALNVVPFSLIEEGLQRAYVVGGGYKYCQLGPGNAFLRFPQDSDLRPVVRSEERRVGKECRCTL